MIFILQTSKPPKSMKFPLLDKTVAPNERQHQKPRIFKIKFEQQSPKPSRKSGKLSPNWVGGTADRPKNPPRTRANGVLNLTAFVLAFLLQEGLAILLEERPLGGPGRASQGQSSGQVAPAERPSDRSWTLLGRSWGGLGRSSCVFLRLLAVFLGLLGFILAILPSTCRFLSILGPSGVAPTLENHCFP